MIWVSLPRLVKWISASPATSSAKRVQRSHRMQRSRSRQHEVADRDRLLVVALLLDVAALARAVAERLVLQRALAALVAHRAVERVVGEQQLEHALLHAAWSSATRCRPSCRARPATMHDGCRPRAAAGVDLDQAHAAHADRASSARGSRSAGCTRRRRSAAAMTSSPLRATTRHAVDRDAHRVGVGRRRRGSSAGSAQWWSSPAPTADTGMSVALARSWPRTRRGTG